MTNHLWIYRRPDESILTLGEHSKPDSWAGATIHFTDNRELAQWWARELRAGRPPVDENGAGTAPSRPRRLPGPRIGLTSIAPQLSTGAALICRPVEL